MTTLTIITPKNALNHHYKVTEAGIGDGTFYIVLDDDEVDSFLIQYLKGETGYPIQIDADTIYLKTKLPCVVSASEKTEQLTALTLKMVAQN